MALFDPFPEILADTFTTYLPQTTPYLEGNNNSDDHDNKNNNNISKPFVTLTYASSLDSQISLAPGVQTLLSGPLTKHFTHHLRSCHAAILVGVNTAIADDPGLNCRIRHVDQDAQPRPIILDPQARWLCSWLRYPSDNIREQHHHHQQQEEKEFHVSQNGGLNEIYSDIKNCRLLQTFYDGKGLSPWVLVREHNHRQYHYASISQEEDIDTHEEEEEEEEERMIAEKAFVDAGGHIIYIPNILPPRPPPATAAAAVTTLTINSDDNNSIEIHAIRNKWSWSTILSTLASRGITSLMVEGGASVINDLLCMENLHLVDSVIITIAPVFLGQGGVVVSPPSRTGTRLDEHKSTQSESNNDGATRVTAVKFKDVRWCVMESDVVMVARPLV